VAEKMSGAMAEQESDAVRQMFCPKVLMDKPAAPQGASRSFGMQAIEELSGID
jgi:hypothetical protein